MTRKEIELALSGGARLVIQDKANGSVYCVVRIPSGPRHVTKRIRFDQYIHQFDMGHLKLVERTSIKGYDHCEYIAGSGLFAEEGDY